MPNVDANKCQYNLICDVLLVLIILANIGSYLIMLLLLFKDPCGLIFLGSLIPKEYFTPLIKFLVIVYHAYLLLVGHAAVCMFAPAVIMYAYYLAPFYLRELRVGLVKYRTDPSLRTTCNIQVMIRALQLLHEHTLNFLGIWLVIGNGYFMYTVIFCSAVLMCYWSELLPIPKVMLCGICLIFLGFWLFLLELGRYFFVKGAKTMRSWKVCKWGSNTKQMIKFQKSCRPILLSWGTQFVIRRATVLNFLRGIVRGTFRTLIVMKKQI